MASDWRTRRGAAQGRRGGDPHRGETGLTVAPKKRHARGMRPLAIGLACLPPDRRDEAIREHVEEQFRRMSDLADSLGIPDDFHRWYALALHLARQHVPELSDEKPRGAPKKWGEYELGVLAVELERERDRQGGASIKDAARALADRKPWCSFLRANDGTYFGPDPAAALERQYSEAKRRRLTPALRDAFLYHVHQDTVDQWDAEVLALAVPERK